MQWPVAEGRQWVAVLRSDDGQRSPRLRPAAELRQRLARPQCLAWRRRLASPRGCLPGGGGLPRPGGSASSNPAAALHGWPSARRGSSPGDGSPCGGSLGGGAPGGSTWSGPVSCFVSPGDASSRPAALRLARRRRNLSPPGSVAWPRPLAWRPGALGGADRRPAPSATGRNGAPFPALRLLAPVPTRASPGSLLARVTTPHTL